MKTVFTTSNANYVVLGKDGKKLKGKKMENSSRFYQIKILMEFMKLQKKDLILS